MSDARDATLPMVYRETPGSLPALKHAVERLATVLARRRALEAIPHAKQDDRARAALAELDAEQAALEGVAAHFDHAFADAVEAVLAAGGPHAAKVGALLDVVPTMAERTRAAQSVFVALRASRGMLGAVEVRAAGARRSTTQRSRVGTHSRASVEARLSVSVTRLLFRLDAALEFSRPAELDSDVVEGIQTIRDRLARDVDAGAEVLACGLVAVRADLERLVTTTAAAVDELDRRARGSARRLFELVAYR